MRSGDQLCGSAGLPPLDSGRTFWNRSRAIDIRNPLSDIEDPASA